MRGLALLETAVAGPLEHDGSALLRDREEGDERIRGNRRGEGRAEDLGAVIGAEQFGDDVARDHLALIGAAEARLHDVRDQRLDLDDLAAFGGLRYVDQRAGHLTIAPGRRAR